jgi:hypothetical protein
MEAVSPSEISVNIYHYQTTRSNILCQSRFGVRIPNRQTFETDHKLDILVAALLYIMVGGVIKAFIVAPFFV